MKAAWVDPSPRLTVIYLREEVTPEDIARVIGSFGLEKVTMCPSAFTRPRAEQQSWAEAIAEHTAVALEPEYERR